MPTGEALRVSRSEKNITINDVIIFGRPAIGEEEIQEVVEFLRSGWIGNGPKVAQFESDFAAYTGVPANHALAVSSCTAAHHVSTLAANLEPGPEVITSPLTFCATVNVIIHAGRLLCWLMWIRILSALIQTR